MKKLFTFTTILFFSSRLYAQYPKPLPSSGNISLFTIADWMLAAGEITSKERAGKLSYSFLNQKSHLQKKTPPYSMSDWYGYGSLKLLKENIYQGISKEILTPVFPNKTVLYPNPGPGNFTINGEIVLGSIRIDITTVDGKSVFSKSYPQNNSDVVLDLTSQLFDRSIYVIRVTNLKTKVSFVEKLIVQK